LYLYNELSKTAFENLIIFKLLLHICDISKINLIIIVPIEHFNLPLGIISIEIMFFFKNHRHKSRNNSAYFSLFFYQSSETSGTLAVKLLDNGIIPHNQRKRTRSIKPCYRCLCLTTAFRTPSILTSDFSIISFEFNLLSSIQSYLIFSDG
jgi:hypothetical protein